MVTVGENDTGSSLGTERQPGSGAGPTESRGRSTKLSALSSKPTKSWRRSVPQDTLLMEFTWRCYGYGKALLAFDDELLGVVSRVVV